MRKNNIFKSTIKYVLIFFFTMIGLSLIFDSNRAIADENDGYFEDFDDADIGVTQVQKRWALMISDGQETGVSLMPDEEIGKCLKISNIPDGVTNGGDWMNNSKALTNFEKEVNIMSVDFYIPLDEKSFSNDDCAFVQLRQSSANFVAFAIYGDGIKEYKTNGDEPEVYKTNVKKGEWINVTIYYYPKQKTFSLYYKEKGSEAELILENKAITPSKWTATQMTDFRIMSIFKPSNELHYFYVDNINVYATNRLPYLKNVVINGVKNEKVGETLECGFVYQSDLGIAEKEVAIQWYRSAELKAGDIQGNIEYFPIEGATSRTYVTKEEDLYHYLYYTAKPIDLDGNEGIEYTSGMSLIYLDNAVTDFENKNVGDTTIKEFQIEKNNASFKVEESNGNKYVSIEGKKENDGEVLFEMQSAYQFGLRDKNVVYETDIMLNEKLKAGSIFSLSFVFNKDSSFFGKSVIEALVIEDKNIYVGYDQSFELPIKEWFKLKLYLLNEDELTYLVQILDKDSNTIYLSDKEIITNISANNLYENIGVSSVLVKYDSLVPEDLVKVSMDNIILKYSDDCILLMGGNLGTSTTRNEFEYEFITSIVGDSNKSNIRFECSDGILPRGVSIVGNKLIGSLTRNGNYEFEISAYDDNHIAKAKFYIEVSDTYTVTFNSNNGSEIDSLVIAPNTKIDSLEVPSRTGYIFVGWKKEDGNFWDKDSDLVTHDETLTAEWKIKEYLISFIDFDGSLLYSFTVPYKNIIEIPSELSNMDWYMDQDYVEEFREDLTMPARSLVLYALKDTDNQNGNNNKNSGCKSAVMIPYLSALIIPTLYFLEKRKEDESSLYNE